MKNERDDQNKLHGPFEVVFRDTTPSSYSASNAAVAHEVTVLPDHEEPVRKLDCSHYETCLELAAALNWESFTCAQCKGEINESLRWRAGQSTRKDAVAKAICGSTKVSVLRKE
jgi:hypothetical protein